MKEFFNGRMEGLISLDTLYVGSKSEALYPVLTSHDGSRYRIHIEGNEIADAPFLAHLDGRLVEMFGRVDDIKGHKRILIAPNLKESITLIAKGDLDCDASDKAEALNNDLPPIDPQE